MDQATLSSRAALAALLKTNRPPTDQERAIILESMAPTKAKLKVVEMEISDTVAHIQALKSQVEQAEIKLQRLRDEEAAILETFADHRRVFSPFRNLPEDVLREICMTCVEGDIPTLAYKFRSIPLPYILGQICTGMRHIALTMPLLWASMNVDIGLIYFRSHAEYDEAYSILARKASTWFERADGLPLSLSMKDPGYIYAKSYPTEPDPSDILFETLLSYSTRWKKFHYDSDCSADVSTRITRIAALTAIDVPLLRSLSLHINFLASKSPVLDESTLLTIPTLKNLTLETDTVQKFTVNWAILTSVTLRSDLFSRGHSIRQIAQILQKTKNLVFCDVDVDPPHPDEHYHPDKINLLCLKTLIVSEALSRSETTTSRMFSVLDLIDAPTLEIFHVHGAFLDTSVSDFLKRSPHIWQLSLPYFDKNTSLAEMMGFLCHCPSLTTLSLQPGERNTNVGNVDNFLKAFVEEADGGVICPCLQYFDFRGEIDFSVQALRVFLERKHTVNAPGWRRVSIEFTGIKAAETRQEMLDLVSQKKAAGMEGEISLALTGYRYKPFVF